MGDAVKKDEDEEETSSESEDSDVEAESDSDDDGKTPHETAKEKALQRIRVSGPPVDC